MFKDLLSIFHTFFSVSIVDFEQVNVIWVSLNNHRTFTKCYVNVRSIPWLKIDKKIIQLRAVFQTEHNVASDP